MTISIEVPLRLRRPIIGFEGLSSFELIWGNHALFEVRRQEPCRTWPAVLMGPRAEWFAGSSTFLLRSSQVPDLGFLGVSAELVVPGYLHRVCSKLPVELAEELELSGWDEALAIALVRRGNHAECIKANLLAPVVVNVRRRLAAQVILTEGDLPAHEEVLCAR